MVGGDISSGDSDEQEEQKTELKPESTKYQPDQWRTIVMKLCGCKEETDYERVAVKLVSYTFYPLLFGLQLAVYLRFYYRHELTFTKECLLLFLICLSFDVMIVWSYRLAATRDPGFMEENFIASFSDVDEE